MQWVAVTEAWSAKLMADSALTTALGGLHLYAAQAQRPVRIPSVEYLWKGDRLEESWNPMVLQVDLWAKTSRAAATIEGRIRTLTHHDLQQVLGSLRLWMRYRDGRTLDFSAEPGVIHRVLEFDVTILRDKYTS